MSAMPLDDDQPLTDAEAAEAAASTGGVKAIDLDAPFGRRADGRPRKRRAPGDSLRYESRPPGSARTRTRAPRPKPAPKQRVPTPRAPDIAKGARGLLNTLSALLMVLPRVTRNDAYALDAMAVEMNADALTTGLVEVAEQVPLVKAGLEYFAKASPFAGLVEALGSVATQIAANHGVVPAGTMGTLPADQLQTAFAERIGVSLLDIPGALSTLTDPE